MRIKPTSFCSAPSLAYIIFLDIQGAIAPVAEKLLEIFSEFLTEEQGSIANLIVYYMVESLNTNDNLDEIICPAMNNFYKTIYQAVVWIKENNLTYYAKSFPLGIPLFLRGRKIIECVNEAIIVNR